VLLTILLKLIPKLISLKIQLFIQKMLTWHGSECLPFPVTMKSIKIGRLCPGLPGQKSQDHISKITREKSAGGMAHVTEHLPCKCKNPEFKPQYGKPLL
jgi:hypothetical protein